MKQLGVGVVGCGVISTIYMQNLAAFRELRLVACADVVHDGGAGAGRAVRHPGARHRGACCAIPRSTSCST